MCGIFCLLHSHEDEDTIKFNFNKGQNRGPENTTFEKITGGYIGFHRLAINGLNNTSNQPFCIKNCLLICNGEIYNFKELFKMIDCIPETNSDCEIIIHLYKKYGIKYTLQLLDGVFAFILIDLTDNKMYISRDPFGVRPLFYLKSLHTIGFASQLKQLSYFHSNIKHYYTNVYLKQFHPGTFICYKLEDNNWNYCYKYNYFSLPFYKSVYNENNDMLLDKIKYYFEKAVVKRILGTSDRPIACLLSGGLDSSLVTSIVSRYVPNLETFSIGIKGGEDLKYAKIVADYLGTKHTQIEFSEDEFFNAIPLVIREIESYDTTTVRASVGNYLIAKWISEHSNAKVIFNGDGSDELMGGYLYFGHAPTDLDFDHESRRLLSHIHYFDVLRSDRSISSHGLEPRTPFLDREWTNFYLSINSKIRSHSLNEKCEKYLIREAFNDKTYLPDDILFRKKEAFSDGVSSINRSWYKIIDEKVENAFIDQDISNNWQELLTEYQNKYNPPKTKEQLYYRVIYDLQYPNCDKLIPYYWMPKFVLAKDASARTLDIYS